MNNASSEELNNTIVQLNNSIGILLNDLYQSKATIKQFFVNNNSYTREDCKLFKKLINESSKIVNKIQKILLQYLMNKV